MIKVLTIVGARPQFIKAAALSRAFKDSDDVINEVIVHTGQHFDKNMSDIFFEEMEIPRADYNLDIHGLSHGAMTGQMIEGIEKVILKETPNYVLVYGDTNSTIAGALAAKKLHIPVVHVEAGLRSFNMRMPEEVNRILTDRISDLLFCPTQTAVDNLSKEGFENFDLKVIRTGDIMLDAALYYKQKSDEKSTIVADMDLQTGKYVLATIHRAENTDNLEKLKAIVESLNEVNSKTKVVVPLHPRTRKILDKNNIQANFSIIEPVGYFDMIQLLSNCAIVITDSGGLQKEAYFFDKYCVTLREETEWVELIHKGYNKLAGTDKATIVSTVNEFLSQEFIKREELYGDGNSARLMKNQLLEHHKKAS